jgi:hypothetical protein
VSFSVLPFAISVPTLSWEGALLRLVVAAALGGAWTSTQAQEATDRIAGLSGVRRLQWVR